MSPSMICSTPSGFGKIQWAIIFTAAPSSISKVEDITCLPFFAVNPRQTWTGMGILYPFKTLRKMFTPSSLGCGIISIPSILFNPSTWFPLMTTEAILSLFKKSALPVLSRLSTSISYSFSYTCMVYLRLIHMVTDFAIFQVNINNFAYRA